MSIPNLILPNIAVGDTLPTLAKEISATTIVLGALASRDWRPMHHDSEFAVQRNGVRNIFMNTPNFASWLERYITDWTGPHGRLGRLTFQMRDSVFPGNAMEINGRVTEVNQDEKNCGWVNLQLRISQEGRICLNAVARVAIPVDATDNPWARHDADWLP